MLSRVYLFRIYELNFRVLKIIIFLSYSYLRSLITITQLFLALIIDIDIAEMSPVTAFRHGFISQSDLEISDVGYYNAIWRVHSAKLHKSKLQTFLAD